MSSVKKHLRNFNLPQQALLLLDNITRIYILTNDEIVEKVIQEEQKFEEEHEKIPRNASNTPLQQNFEYLFIDPYTPKQQSVRISKSYCIYFPTSCFVKLYLFKMMQKKCATISHFEIERPDPIQIWRCFSFKKWFLLWEDMTATPLLPATSPNKKGGRRVTTSLKKAGFIWGVAPSRKVTRQKSD